MPQHIYHQPFDLDGETVRISIMVANPGAQLLTVVKMTDTWIPEGGHARQFGSVLVRDSEGPRVHHREFMLVRMRSGETAEMLIPDDAGAFVGRLSDSKLSTWLVFGVKTQPSKESAPQPQSSEQPKVSPPATASNGGSNGQQPPQRSVASSAVSRAAGTTTSTPRRYNEEAPRPR
jgi:hypothetical protein